MRLVRRRLRKAAIALIIVLAIIIGGVVAQAETNDSANINGKVGEDWLMPCNAMDHENVPHYSICKRSLSRDLELYLYDQLQYRGIAWYYEYAICQIFQESQFNIHAHGSDGLDKGLCQFREEYFADYAEEAGLVEYDIMNPIDAIYVYAYVMAKNINMYDGDVRMALSQYYLNNGHYADNYVHDVTRWIKHLHIEK